MENKPAQNIQETFLNTARKERTNITIYLLSGVKLTGRIRSFDKYSVVLETNNQEQLIFKHAISTVAMGRPYTLMGSGRPWCPLPAAPSATVEAAVTAAFGHRRIERQIAIGTWQLDWPNSRPGRIDLATHASPRADCRVLPERRKQFSRTRIQRIEQAKIQIFRKKSSDKTQTSELGAAQRRREPCPRERAFLVGLEVRTRSRGAASSRARSGPLTAAAQAARDTSTSSPATKAPDSRVQR